uniref:Vacuolar ATPase assembly protein VMA22 n=1 Tax=Populus trichocarpa TaxID=3694 RepID=A0A2K2AME7_POPTR
MEEQEEATGFEIEVRKVVGDEDVLRFMDSTDSYLTLLDSLSSTLRQGWLDLAIARQSMGASRINGALLDHKLHSAATSVQVDQEDVDSMEAQPRFILRKWAYSVTRSRNWERISCQGNLAVYSSDIAAIPSFLKKKPPRVELNLTLMTKFKRSEPNYCLCLGL